MLSGGGPRDRPAMDQFGTFCTQRAARSVQCCTRGGDVVDHQNPHASRRCSRPERRSGQPFASRATCLRNRAVTTQQAPCGHVQSSCNFVCDQFGLVVAATSSVHRRSWRPGHHVDAVLHHVTVASDRIRQEHGKRNRGATRVVVLERNDHFAHVVLESRCGGDAIPLHETVCAQTRPA